MRRNTGQRVANARPLKNRNQTEGNRYYTKGDANLSEDPEPVYFKQIVGEVVLTIPKVGIFIEWLKTPSGIISAVAFMALVVIGIGLLKKI